MIKYGYGTVNIAKIPLPFDVRVHFGDKIEWQLDGLSTLAPQSNAREHPRDHPRPRKKSADYISAETDLSTETAPRSDGKI
jgi:hypothetical protein